jgi:hypothetical protein
MILFLLASFILLASATPAPPVGIPSYVQKDLDSTEKTWQVRRDLVNGVFKKHFGSDYIEYDSRVKLLGEAGAQDLAEHLELVESIGQGALDFISQQRDGEGKTLTSFQQL